LFITSPEGKILDMNKKGIEMFGYNTKEEILNLDLVHDAYSDPNDRKKIFPMVNEQGSAEYEVVVKKKNGDKMITRCSLIAVKDKGVITTYRGIIRDITESKKTENEIKKSLEEKEVLLREIHHRVKNNLQIIASLLHLQEVSEEEKEIVDVLKESEGRVKSMAMVHEKLYQSPTFSDINFKQYIEKLVYDILYTYKIPTGTIKTNMIIEEINLNIDTAIPLGLIVNELVTNSVKHAFPQSEGTIIIKLKSLDEQMELTIADNGIGLSKDLDLEKTETLGIKIVNSLVNQIDGKIKLDRTNGIEFKITFKELKYKERL
jgi:PAS domain S-box-containing protein